MGEHFDLNHSKRYRRTVLSIAGSCLNTATPPLASEKQAACLVALDIVEDGTATLAKVERPIDMKRKLKKQLKKCFSQDHCIILKIIWMLLTMNRLLPAMNKLWLFFVICVQSKNPVAVRRCLGMVSKVVQICGRDFFSRRFHMDGPHFWKLPSTSPFQKKLKLQEEKTPLLRPYSNTSISSVDSLAEVSSLKVQVAALNMMAGLSQNKESASALEVVLKKVSGLVVGIACSGGVDLRDASVNALCGLATIDPDLIWLLVAHVTIL